LCSTGESGGTEAARLAASIGPALLGSTVVGYALRLAALDALALFTIEAGRAFAAAPAAAVAAALTVIALGQADAAPKQVTDKSVRASPAFAATAVGTALLSVAAGQTVTVAVGIAIESRRAFAAVTVAAVGTALFAGALRGTVEAGVEFILTITLKDCIPRARFDWLGTANFEDTLPDHDVLLLGLGAGVLPATIGADFVVVRTVPEAVE
jgi:hypothetical protein